MKKTTNVFAASKIGLRPPVSICLHSIAAILLCLFGLSHIGFLTINDIYHDLPNAVFPFLTNWTLYLITAILELSTGVLCWKMRGFHSTNIVILTFVGVILFYRWAFRFTGGTECGCTGLLGRLLHISKSHEAAVSRTALIILVLTTIPWICSLFKRLHKRFYRSTIAILALSAYQMVGANTIEIHGLLDTSEYNPQTGVAYTNQQTHSTFVVTICDNQYKICLTNSDDASWFEFVYDGTNSYTFNSLRNLSNFETEDTNADLAVTIEPSARYLPAVWDNGGSVVWIAYGLKPEFLHTNKNGLVDIPLPGYVPRRNPGEFGWKWLISFTPDGRFVSDCQVIRDKSLDIDTEKEFLRFEMDYPETVGNYNKYMVDLRTRQNYPNGYLKESYRCLEWYNTNGISIPKKSKFEANLSPYFTEHPWHVADIEATGIVVREGSERILPGISNLTIVHDYRYKRSNKTRIFRYAEYTLKSGDSWKSDNDPELLAKASDWLIHGKKYNTFGEENKRTIVWSLLVLLTMIPIMAMLWEISKTKRNKQQQ
jgi:hypothetical protein